MFERSLKPEALRTLKAKPRNTVAAVAMLIVATGIMLLIPSITAGASNKLLTELDALGSDAWLASPQSVPGGSPPRLITGVVARVATLPRVSSVTYVVTTTSTVTSSPSDSRARQVLVAGVSSVGSPRISKVIAGERRVAGNLPLAVAGRQAAQRLGILQVPATVYVGGRPVTITGIVEDDPLFPRLTDALMLIPEMALEMDPDGATEELGIRAEDGLDRGLIRQSIDPFDAVALSVDRPPGLVEAKAKSGGILSGLGFLASGTAFAAAIVGVGVIMTSAVRQRSSELALRRVHGASQRSIVRLVLSEGLVLGVLGGSAGIGIGTAILWVIGHLNDWPFVLEARLLLGGLLVSLVSCLVASLIPAIIAVRIQPTDALSIE